MGRKKETIYGVDAFIARMKEYYSVPPIVNIKASFRKGELYIQMFDKFGNEYFGSYVPSEGSYGSKVYKKLMVDYLMGEFGEKKASAKLQETEAKLAEKTPKLSYDCNEVWQWVVRMCKSNNYYDITFDTPNQSVVIRDGNSAELFFDIDNYAKISLDSLPTSKAEEFQLIANDNNGEIIEVFDKFEIK